MRLQIFVQMLGHDMFQTTLHARGDSGIDVKGQGLSGEKNLIFSLFCTPDLFAKGWFN